MKLIELLDRYYVISRIVSANYRASILNAIGHFRAHLGEEPDTSHLSDDSLSGLQAAMLSAGRSRPTVNKVVRTLCALACFARRRGFSCYRPDIERLKESLPQPRCRTVEQFRQLLLAVSGLYGDGVWSATLDAVLRINYDTALRVGDITNALILECDLGAGIVRVVEHKTGRRVSKAISAETIASIRRARRVAERSGFGDQCRLVPYSFASEQPLRKRVRLALKAAGLPHGRKDLFQDVRRLSISAAAAAGLDPTAHAGHSAKWVTSRYYLAADILPPLDVASRLPKLS